MKYTNNKYKIIMKRLRFEWDEEKAKINIGKHGISFPEAATAFLDGGGLVIDDVII